jgi:hypothetical protein
MDVVMRFLVSLASLLALSQASAPLGEPFTIGLGETASIDSTDLSLSFVAVTGDSRCPRDVNCVVAGEAVVVFDARSGDALTELTFRVPPGGDDEQKLDGLTIRILGLEPEADTARKIDAGDYVAKVIVTET